MFIRRTSYTEEQSIINSFYSENNEDIFELIKTSQERETHNNINYSEKSINMIIFLTSLTRDFIKKGMPAEKAFEISENYINISLKYKTLDEMQKYELELISTLRRIYKEFQKTDNNTVTDIINYIHKHFHTPITVSDISKYLNLSESYISDIFNSEMNESVKNYINKLKIDRAKEILLNSEDNLLSISVILGFNSQSYFSKVFKKFTGMSPSEFRKRANWS